MSAIVVIRGAGDRKGSDIIEPLLYSLEAKLARGRAEMDEHATAHVPVTLVVSYRTGLRLGQLVEVNDALQGQSWRGKITGIAHKLDAGEMTTQLSIKRPQENF